MARKKSSMSLKDFHGGEIRSDLPLPSKPGVGTDSASKALGLERTYSDSNRDRFAPAYGQRASNRHNPPPDSGYFPDPSAIGKNYEEDERKPVGGGGAKRPELSAFGGGAYPSHLVTERFPPSGGGYTTRLADLPNDTPPPQNSPPPAERPKLQLQPRSRPLDEDIADLSISPGAEVLTIQRKESDSLGVERPKLNSQPRTETEEFLEQKGTLEGGEEDERPKERPKLNLKPRSQDAIMAPETEQSRPGVFGGARPRDVVLKERGVDKAVIVGVGDTRATDSPNKEAAGARAASPDHQKWGRDDPREDRYVKADPQWRNGPKDSQTRGGRSDKPNSGSFRANGRPEGGSERQGSAFTRSGNFGDNRGGFGDNRAGFGGNQWRQSKPASPPVRSALIDTSAKKDPWEGPLTSLQLAEAFSRSASMGSPNQGRGPWGPSNGIGGTPPGRGNFNRGPAGGSFRSGSFGRTGGYGRGDMGYNPSGPRSQVYQDDERGELVLPGKRPQREERY